MWFIKKPKQSDDALFEEMNKLVSHKMKDSLDYHEITSNYLTTLTKAQRDEFFNKIHLASDNTAFKTVLNYLSRRQVEWIAEKSANWEQVLFGRATLNGFYILKEELDRLESIWQDEHQPKEKFEETEII